MQGCIPLSFAIKWYPIDWVVYMIKESDMLSPYHMRCAIDRESYDIVRALVDKGVEVSVIHVKFAIQNKMSNSVKYMLTRYPKLLDAQDTGGSSLLMEACSSENEACAMVFIEMGADANHKSKSGSTALLLAAQNGHYHVVNALLQMKGVDVNHETEGKNTALHFAVARGHKDVVRVLLKRGANVMTKSIRNMTAADIAYENGELVVLQILMEHGSSLPDVERWNSSDECKWFVRGYKMALHKV